MYGSKKLIISPLIYVRIRVWKSEIKTSNIFWKRVSGRGVALEVVIRGSNCGSGGNAGSGDSGGVAVVIVVVVVAVVIVVADAVVIVSSAVS